jgi:hypothetical protein
MFLGIGKIHAVLTFGLTPDQLAKTLVAVTGIHQHDMRALLPVLAD